MKNRISVTGSEGFIGRWLCRYLNVPVTNQFDIVNGDDCTLEDTQSDLVTLSDTVVLLHAISGIKACEAKPELAMATNAESVIDIALKAKQAGVRRLILASSSSVYGEINRYVVDEQHEVKPRSHYGFTKLTAEKILDQASETFELVILRKSNVYGWGTHWKPTVIDSFLDQYLRREAITLEGTGQQKRDFADLMDVVRLYGQIATAKKVRSGIYNVGGGEALSVRAVAELVNNLGEAVFGYRVPVVSRGQDTGASGWHDFRYDYSKATMEWGFRPMFTVQDHVKARLKQAMRDG